MRQGGAPMKRSRPRGGSGGGVRLPIACDGSIGSHGASGTGGTGAKPNDPGIIDQGGNTGAGSATGTGTGGTTGTVTPCTAGTPPATTRLFRLTHTQYDNTVRALTGLDVRPSTDFPVDQNQAGLRSRHGPAGRRRARQEPTAPPPRRSRRRSSSTRPRSARSSAAIPPAATACARLVHRRLRPPRLPPAADRRREDAATSTLFGKGADAGRRHRRQLPQGRAARRRGDAAVAELPLPRRAVDAGERRPDRARRLRAGEPAVVTSWSTARPTTRCWTPPRRGSSRPPTASRTQARRLVATDAAQGDGARLPPPVAGDGRLRQQADQGVEVPDGDARSRAGARAGDGALRRRGDVHAGQGLRVADDGAVHLRQQDDRAALRRQRHRSAAACTRVDLDPTKRAGLFTQLGFLATHAYSNQSSPIHRGAFIQRSVLCATIPDPPPNIPQLPPLMATQTTRAAGRHAHRARRVHGLPPRATSTRSASASRTTTPPASAARRRTASTIDATGTLAGTGGQRPRSPTACRRVGGDRRLARGARCYARPGCATRSGAPSRRRRQLRHRRCWARDLGDDNYKVTDLMVDITRTTGLPVPGERTDEPARSSDATFLRGLGGVTLGLPFLETFAPRKAAAQTAATPKRLAVFFNHNGVNMPNWFPTTAYGALTRGVVHGHRARADRLVRAEDPAAARAAPGAARLRPRSERRRRPRARRRLQADRGAAGRHDREVRDRRLDRSGDRQGGQPERQGRAEPDGRLPQQGRARLHLVRRRRPAGEPVPGPVEGVQGLGRHGRHRA